MVDDFIRSRLKSRKAALRLQKLETIAREAEQADLSHNDDGAEPPKSKRKVKGKTSAT